MPRPLPDDDSRGFFRALMLPCGAGCPELFYQAGLFGWRQARNALHFAQVDIHEAAVIRTVPGASCRCWLLAGRAYSQDSVDLLLCERPICRCRRRQHIRVKLNFIKARLGVSGNFRDIQRPPGSVKEDVIESVTSSSASKDMDAAPSPGTANLTAWPFPLPCAVPLTAF